MKRIKFLISITMMVMMCFMFAACPEPVPEPEDLLIGAWIDIDNEGTSYETKTVLTFSSNGKFEYNYYGGGSFGRTGKGYYSYNDKQKTLVLTYTSMDRTDLYIVQTLTSKSLVLLDPEDLYAWSFSKQKSGSNKEENGSEKEEANSTTGTLNGHEWVDLGLSVKWATCNVGADSPEDYGDYFAWGETSTKSEFNWNTYKWCNGSHDFMTKYCTDSRDGIADNRTTLTFSDDVASVKWGSKWRMPTEKEIKELREKCISIWTTRSGVEGEKIIGPNGNSIFLPAAGNIYNTEIKNHGTICWYWSASLSINVMAHTLASSAEILEDEHHSGMGSCGRDYGNSVRPVTE